MTTLCKIENGIVTNRAHFDEDVPDGWVPEGETWIASEDAQIGWSYDGSSFTPPPQTIVTISPDNYKPMILRRADKLDAEGDEIGALKLRLSIGA